MLTVNPISTLSSVLKRHFLPASATFVSVVGAAVFYLSVAASSYQATTRLIIDERSVSVSDLGKALSQVPDGSPGGPNPSATQAELVKSERVLQRALEIMSSQGKSRTAAAMLTLDDLKTVKVKIIPATNILELSYQSEKPEIAAMVVNGIAEAMVYENVAAIRSEATSVREFLEIKIPQQQSKLAQAERKESEFRQRTGIVSIEDQTTSLVSSLAAVEDQERLLTGQLQEARARDNLLKQVTSVSALRTAYASVRAGQNEQLKNLRNELAALETQVIDARSRLGDRHPDLLALLERREAARSLYSQQLAQVLGYSPSAQQLAVPAPAQSGQSSSGGNGTARQINQGEASDEVSQDLISKFIVGQIESTALESRLQVVKAARIRLGNIITQLPIQQRPLASLIRQREETENTLKLLQSKLEEAQVAEAQLVGNLRIIGKAEVPKKAFAPKPLVVLAIAIATGLILSTGMILLLEMMDDLIHDPADVDATFKQPVLGVLPGFKKLPEDTEQLERYLDNSDWINSYRMLFKAFDFHSDKKPKIIAVSSASYGEGKSTVALSIAAVAAALSRRTLLIDADFRQPLQHYLFRISPQPGLTDVVEGGRSFLDTIQPTEVTNLDLLPYGQSIARPSTVSESSLLKALLLEAAARYDLIVIDTPPVSYCADAVTLGDYSDILLLVVRQNYSTRKITHQTMVDLQKSSAPLVGLVINETPDLTQREHDNFIKPRQPRVKPLRSSINSYN